VVKRFSTTAHLQNNIGYGVRQQYIIQKPDPEGTFSFRVPLKHIFGFCDDYDKVVYGFKHQLTVVRKVQFLLRLLVIMQMMQPEGLSKERLF